MFKPQGGKFSSVFATSKDKRNQETPLHTGNSSPRKLLKYLTAYRGSQYLLSGRKIRYLLQLMVTAKNNFQSNY